MTDRPAIRRVVAIKRAIQHRGTYDADVVTLHEVNADETVGALMHRLLDSPTEWIELRLILDIFGG